MVNDDETTPETTEKTMCQSLIIWILFIYFNLIFRCGPHVFDTKFHLGSKMIFTLHNSSFTAAKNIITM